MGNLKRRIEALEATTKSGCGYCELRRLVSEREAPCTHQGLPPYRYEEVLRRMLEDQRSE